VRVRSARGIEWEYVCSYQRVRSSDSSSEELNRHRERHGFVVTGPGPDPRAPVALFLPHQDSYFAQSRHRPSLISMPNLVGLVDRYIVCMQMPRIYNLQTLGTEYQRPKPLWKDWSPGQHRHNLPAQATLQHISAPAGYRFTYPTMPS